MKRLIAAVLSVFCLLSMAGCGKQPQQVNKNQLIAEGNVINVKVSSLPEQYNYSFHGEDAKAIIDYQGCTVVSGDSIDKLEKASLKKKG